MQCCTVTKMNVLMVRCLSLVTTTNQEVVGETLTLLPVESHIPMLTVPTTWTQRKNVLALAAPCHVALQPWYHINVKIFNVVPLVHLVLLLRSPCLMALELQRKMFACSSVKCSIMRNVFSTVVQKFVKVTTEIMVTFKS